MADSSPWGIDPRGIANRAMRQAMLEARHAAARSGMLPTAHREDVVGSEMPDITGRTLGGRYSVDVLIGRGGFGAVYRGTHLRLGDTVAIKVITDPRPDLSARFHREARVQRRLRHPATVRMLDFDIEDDGLHYMVQEFVEGRTLKTILRTEGPLAPHRLVMLMSAVLDALDEAHAQGILHRDLKPENIMVVDGRHGEEARLLDFGIAKLRDLDDTEETLTAKGMVLGTLAYMAPEQVVRSELGPPTDIYQLGAVMYRLLSGRKPFVGTAQEMLRQHIAAPPPPLPDPVPRPLAAVVMRAMQKDPAARYATAHEMKAALSVASHSMLATTPAVPRLDIDLDMVSVSDRPVPVREPTASSSLHLPRGEVDAMPTAPRPAIGRLAIVAGVLAVLVAAVGWWRLAPSSERADDEGTRTVRVGTARPAVAPSAADGAEADDTEGEDTDNARAAVDDEADDETPSLGDLAELGRLSELEKLTALQELTKLEGLAEGLDGLAGDEGDAVEAEAGDVDDADPVAARPAARRPRPTTRREPDRRRREPAEATPSRVPARAVPTAAAPARDPALVVEDKTGAFAAALDRCACPTARTLLGELAGLDPSGNSGRRRLYRNACQIAGPKSCLR